MASVLLYLGGAIFVPGRAFRRLAKERRRFAKGFRVVFLVGTLYTLSAAGLAVSGALIPAGGRPGRFRGADSRPGVPAA